MPVDASLAASSAFPSILRLARIVADAAKALSFGRADGILLRKLVSILAVGTRHLFGNACRNSLNWETVANKNLTCDNIRETKAAPRSFYNRVDLLAAKVCQVGSSVFLPIDRNPPCGPCVSGLLDFSSPSAVGRLIVPIRVNPVKRMPIRRLWPHVPFKRPKGFPFGADRNPSPSVMLPTLDVWVSASRFHSEPRAVEWWFVLVGHLQLLNSAEPIMHNMPEHATGSTKWPR